MAERLTSPLVQAISIPLAVVNRQLPIAGADRWDCCFVRIKSLLLRQQATDNSSSFVVNSLKWRAFI
jgi:hypothetical protein